MSKQAAPPQDAHWYKFLERTYGYEPLEAIHDHTAFPEYTELYFTNYGAVAFLGENDEVIAILNHRSLLDIVEAAG